MSRKKMVTFDSADYMKRLKRKKHTTEESIYAWMAKSSGMQVDTVKEWFRKGRLPSFELTFLDIFLCPEPKPVYTIEEKEEELPLVEMCEKAIVYEDGEVVEEVPIVQYEPGDWTAEEAQMCPYPRAMFFIKHAYDYDFTGDERVAYINCLAELVLKCEEVHR